ncbi:FtsX-like permease family protein [Algoriphagus sp. D3-2-R+10]|uniref:ABC transporter permease n=1 Tax=Algoriphagus aurantiacus TaxID=3103948 RepID=UPI002B3BA824|nr:ABC transporter permease [Algoriphagus sp. D3-2-R+10]MEB2776346.1 FtsX-like permease family protein [Algoriphagus sp. D3-2-R+10]
MLKNYFKIAYQNLRKNPGYSLINIGGLGIGIACCLLIFQYVTFETSFDKFHENGDDIYHVSWHRVQNDGEPSINASTGWPVGPALADETPEVIRYARLHPEYGSALISNPNQPEKTFKERRIYYADSAFTQMFSYPLVSGNPERALEPGTLLITQAAAIKYFGSEDPIGKTLDVRGWFGGDFLFSGVVNGILRDVPANSHLQFDFLLPMADLFQNSDYNNPSTGWGWNNFITYVQLRHGSDPIEVDKKFSEIYMRHRQEDFQQSNVKAYVTSSPLMDIYLDEDLPLSNVAKGSSSSVYFFTVIGLITLLVALVNYINLATAGALSRAREVGVRKAIGAQKSQLVFQFLCESALTVLLSTILGFALAGLALNPVNSWAGVNLTFALWSNSEFWGTFPIIFLVIVLLSGLYPAFMLATFRPMEVLKGNTGTSGAGMGMRRGLIVFQFSISIVLLIGTIVVFKQVNYMQDMELGMELEQIVTVPGPGLVPEGVNKGNVVETFTQELSNLPAVLKVGTSGTLPGGGFAFGTNGFKKATADQSEEIHASGTSIDTSFVRLYGLEFVAGSIKNSSYSVPEGEPARILINETAAYSLGYDTPSEALGEELSHGRVVGVLKDFSWSSAHNAMENIIFYLSENSTNISIKVGATDLPQTIIAVEELYKSHFPGNPFEYAFADEQFDQQYKNDLRFMRLFTAFTSLAIFIACLGLLGLVTFTARQRTKEIGIRKVLGASISSLARLLSSDFVKLVGIAFIIASPIAWFLMGKWLEAYAYRIDIEWWMFVAAGIGAVFIALLTVSFQAVKAALMNPVKSLKSE